MRNLWQRFRSQSLAAQVLIGLFVLLILTAVSPLTFLLFLLAFVVCAVVLLIRLLLRRPAARWGVRGRAGA